MKKSKIVTYTMCFFSIVILVLALFLTQNGYSIPSSLERLFSFDVYAASEEETASSSTSTNTPSSNENMVQLLARLVNGEARGEPYQGQVAVAAVILNRVKSPQFPNTIAGVIYQDSQFSCVKDGQFDAPIEKDSTVYKAAQEAMSGADPTNGALYFYNPKKTSNKWLYSLPVVLTVGDHKFCSGEAQK